MSLNCLLYSLFIQPDLRIKFLIAEIGQQVHAPTVQFVAFVVHRVCWWHDFVDITIVVYSQDEFKQVRSARFRSISVNL